MAPKPNADAALWRRAMRGVKPLAPRPEPPPSPAPELKAPETISSPQPTETPAISLPRLTLDHAAGYDRANAERLKRGRHPVEARLDLHGMTQDEAHRALAGFIRAARGAGKRCVLVITGRGKIGGGVLRNAVPRWLDEPEFRPHLLAIAAAQPRDGGAGAIYIMLRRTRAG
ncbi:MAG TPA: Smr/MutS family protein [Stellaceae bacterium]|nr:Smr/MutS family protein [Stellaceae bacterium]